jgi:tetratricopeptide (TPR) repeat protein
MQETMQHIDDFFMGLLSNEEVKTFEERIKKDPAFAADVAFYITSRQAAKEMADDEKKAHFREIYKPGNGYHHQKEPAKIISMRNFARVAAAAASIAAIVVTITLSSGPSLSEVADNYIKKNYQQLDTKMGSENDFEKGVDLYNHGKYPEALSQFESVLQKDSPTYNVVKFAGLSALRDHEYDKALHYFTQLETFRSQYVNSAVFLQATVLMERKHAGDKEQAKLLLQKVHNEKLDGYETADEWLKKF